MPQTFNHVWLQLGFTPTNPEDVETTGIHVHHTQTEALSVRDLGVVPAAFCQHLRQTTSGSDHRVPFLGVASPHLTLKACTLVHHHFHPGY